MAEHTPQFDPVPEAIAAIAPSWWQFILLVIALYIVLGTFLTPSEIIPMRPLRKRSREFSAFISTITPVRLSGTSTAFAWKLKVSP